MISMRYLSFVSGIVIASVTWAFSLYLYSKLSENTNVLAPTGKSSSISAHSRVNNNGYDPDGKEEPWDNHLLFNADKNAPIRKDSHGAGDGIRRWRNSEKLLKQLQPVPIKPFVTFGDGLEELGMIRNMDDERKHEQGYRLYAYNTLVSDNLSLRRRIPDSRNELCRKEDYPDELPNASIVVCFYNEHNTTLLRSVHSIIDRTPKNLLYEIILVNDYSDDGHVLDEELTKYITKNFDDRVKLYKTDKREGLIRARMFGAKKASGDVLIFLDSHIEVNEMWIQPLLSRIASSKKIVAMPVIDIINPDTFQYTSSPLVRGGFNWGLHFSWDNLPAGSLVHPRDFIKPIKSPTMAGGLFAMDRKYFFQLGEYDSGMDVWGGENLEISFRIWMCGGSIELVPCSRVGHIFRSRRPYGSNDPSSMLKNSLRLAHVWMDEYKKYFLRDVKPNVDFGDITDRVALRERLKCKDFAWYLQTVYPELQLPDDTEIRLKEKSAKMPAVQRPIQPWHSRKRNYTDHYQIRLSNGGNLCIQSEKDVKTRGSRLILAPCLRVKSQMWYQTDKNELLLGQLLCMEAANNGGGAPKLAKCHEMGGNQEWRHKGTRSTPIYNLSAGKCLGVARKTKKSQVIMDLCTKSDASTISWDIIRAKLPEKHLR